MRLRGGRHHATMTTSSSVPVYCCVLHVRHKICLLFVLVLLLGTLLRFGEYHFHHQQSLFLGDHHQDQDNPDQNPNQVSSIHHERMMSNELNGPWLKIKTTPVLNTFELEKKEEDDVEKDEEEKEEGDQQRQQREEERFFKSVIVNGTNIIEENTTIEIKKIKKDEQQPITSNHDSHNSHDASNDDSFSACILWMDDNHRLEEWLAYHYYILKLRYVVLNIDPFSRTSPQAIVDRWNGNDDTNNNNNINYNTLKLNMTIITMTDREYIPDYQDRMQMIENARLNSNSSSSKDREYQYRTVRTEYHRNRQNRFYQACSQHLMEQNKSWTSYYDTDEFLTFAHEDGKKQDITRQSSHKMEQPGYVLHRLNAIKREFPPNLYVNQKGLSCLVVWRRRYCAAKLEAQETLDLFSSSKGGIIPEDFMMHSSNNINNNSNNNNSTHNNNNNDDEDLNLNKRKEAIVWKFDTLRYKYLTKGLDGIHTPSPKSIIDLSQPNPQRYIQNQLYTSKKQKQQQTSSTNTNSSSSNGSSSSSSTNSSSSSSVSYNPTHPWEPHYAMIGLCRQESKKRATEVQRVIREEHFELSHYLGSWEYYSFRNDARNGERRTFEVWQERSTMTNKGEHSHVIRPWLQGFVTLVGGSHRASYLLQDAGKIPDNFDVNEQSNDYNATYDLSISHHNEKKKKKR